MIFFSKFFMNRIFFLNFFSRGTSIHLFSSSNFYRYFVFLHCFYSTMYFSLIFLFKNDGNTVSLIQQMLLEKFIHFEEWLNIWINYYFLSIMWFFLVFHAYQVISHFWLTWKSWWPVVTVNFKQRQKAIK